MPAAVPMFLSGASEKLAAIGIKCLAVAGGFLAGYAIGGAAVWAFDRWVLAQKTPDFLKKSIRIVAGIAVALLVALLVFGDGSGGGWFGGGGSGDGSGTGTQQQPDSGKKTDQTTPPVVPPEVKPPAKVDAPKTPDVRPEDRVRVTFLGGDAVQGDRFYLLDDDPSPKSFDELKKAVTARKDGTPRQMVLLVQFPSDPRQRIDENSINVTQVTSWARNVAGLEVVLPGKK